MCVFLRFLLAMPAAVVLDNKLRGTQIYRILVLLPWTVPMIVSANTWRWIFQGDYGLINGTLRHLGFPELAVSWLTRPEFAMNSVLVAATWAGFPFVMMMLLSAMQGLSQELYESGRIDGANAWQLFWHITIPGIKPVIFVVAMLELIGAINAFDMVFAMTAGGPGGSTTLIGILIYRLAFTRFSFGHASALSLIIIVTVVLLALAYLPAQIRRAKTEKV
jgi:multiple sugar transport system permease protein